jgi:hypothetical protein
VEVTEAKRLTPTVGFEPGSQETRATTPLQLLNSPMTGFFDKNSENAFFLREINVLKNKWYHQKVCLIRGRFLFSLISYISG